MSGMHTHVQLIIEPAGGASLVAPQHVSELGDEHVLKPLPGVLDLERQEVTVRHGRPVSKGSVAPRPGCGF